MFGAAAGQAKTHQFNNGSAPTRTDQIGKVFNVVGQNLRECLVCEQFFTRQASLEHSNVACYPAVPHPQPKGTKTKI